jgi:hypothetical protein
MENEDIVNTYTALRKVAGTPREVAAIIGIDQRTIERREARTMQIDPEAMIAMRWAASCSLNKRDIAEIQAQNNRRKRRRK